MNVQASFHLDSGLFSSHSVMDRDSNMRSVPKGLLASTAGINSSRRFFMYVFTSSYSARPLLCPNPPSVWRPGDSEETRLEIFDQADTPARPKKIAQKMVDTHAYLACDRPHSADRIPKLNDVATKDAKNAVGRVGQVAATGANRRYVLPNHWAGRKGH